MVADRAKKAKTEEVEETAATELVDANLVHSIEKLQEIQDDLEKVNEEASDKVLEIEQKYNELRRPVYLKRSEIVKSIPNFWLTAFLSHPVLSDLLNEDDQKTFKYLESLDVEDFKDVKLGYSITFNFKENPYFEDKKLTKTFTFLDEGSTKITGTPIHWKEGMGATNGGESEKKGNKRPIPADDSFFSWFGDSQNKEIVEGLHDEVAEIIKEDLWPNPLKYFNNEPDEDSDEEVDEEEDSDEEGEGDEDEDEGEDDDDEEEE